MDLSPQAFCTIAIPRPAAPEAQRRARVFWVFHCLFWCLITILSIGMSRGVAPETPVAWLAIAIRMSSGFVITAAVYWLFELPQVRQLRRLTRWPLLAIVTAGLLVGSLLLLQQVGINPSMIWAGDRVLGQTIPRLAVGIFWCTSYFAVELLDGLYATELRLAHAEADAARREATAHEHEVHRLQAQMNPHFLFNALNAVVACKDSPEEVARVTQDLADFLRSGLRDSQLLEPLAREVATLEKYLAVQQTRFGAKLDCRIICDRAARGVMVPPMMIQPLLENAITYGMQTTVGPLRVEVSARVAGGLLEVVVANSGTWVAPDSTRSPGTGLNTLRKRLALLVGPAAEVTIETPNGHSRSGDSAVVRIVISMPVARPPDEQLLTGGLPGQVRT